MSTEVEAYRSMPMTGKWEYAGRLAAAEDLLPRAFYGRVMNTKTGQYEQKILPGKVFLVIEYGAMLGIPPLAAINGIHVIEGKPSMSSAMMSGLVRKAGHTLRIRKTGTIETGDFSVTATLIRSDDPDEPITATWTPQRAARAELIKAYKRAGDGWVIDAPKDNWRKYPENMLTWRAVSEVCRIGADDVFMGAAYTPDELGEIPAEESDAAADLLASVESAPTADAVNKLFRSWSNEGITVPQSVAAAVMRRVAMLSAAEAVAATAHQGAGEEEAVIVDEETPEAADDAHGQQEAEEEAVVVDEESDPLIADARRVMEPDVFEAWLAERRSGATA